MRHAPQWSSVRLIGPVLACALVVGCGSSSKSGGSGSSAGAQTGVSAQAQPGKGHSIGVVEFDMADTPSALVANSYVKAAKRLGYDVSAVDSSGSPANSVSAIQNFVQKKVDVIWVQLWEASQVQAGMIAAHGAGIPVIGIGGGLGGASGYRFTAAEGPSSGKVLGQYIAGHTGSPSAMLVIGYSPGSTAREREQALNSAISARGIKVSRQELNVTDVNQSTTTSVNAWLNSHPKGSASSLAIWVPSSCCIAPAATAVRQAGRSDVKVYGFVDATAAALRPLQTGIVAAEASDDFAGDGKAEAAATLGVIKGGANGPQRSISLPAQLVTKATLASFRRQHPELR